MHRGPGIGKKIFLIIISFHCVLICVISRRYYTPMDTLVQISRITIHIHVHGGPAGFVKKNNPETL